MYSQTSGGTAAVHLIAKRPIIVPIIAALLAIGAWAGTPTAVEQPKVITMKAPAPVKVATAKTPIKTKTTTFDAIKKMESDNTPMGVHPDGKSYGAAGLTKNALKDVLPGYSDDVYYNVLNDHDQSVKYAEMYFNRLKKYYKGDETLAIIAYHHGIGNVDRRLKKGVPMYKDYLAQVNKYRKG